MEKLEVRNRKSAEALVVSQNAEIDFVVNPKTNKVFFTCGDITGYCSPAVRAKYETVELEELQYAECKKANSGEWIPCLMMVGNFKQNVKRSLGSNKLR